MPADDVLRPLPSLGPRDAFVCSATKKRTCSYDCVNNRRRPQRDHFETKMCKTHRTTDGAKATLGMTDKSTQQTKDSARARQKFVTSPGDGLRLDLVGTLHSSTASIHPYTNDRVLRTSRGKDEGLVAAAFLELHHISHVAHGVGILVAQRYSGHESSVHDITAPGWQAQRER